MSDKSPDNAVAFGRVPSDVLAGSLKRFLRSDALVYLAIALHTDREWAADPSLPRIISLTELGERTVDRALIRLEAAGLLTIERGGGRGHRNHYHLTTNPATKDDRVSRRKPRHLGDGVSRRKPRHSGPQTPSKRRELLSSLCMNREATERQGAPSMRGGAQRTPDLRDPPEDGSPDTAELDTLLTDWFRSPANISAAARRKAESLIDRYGLPVFKRAVNECKTAGQPWGRWGWTINRIVKAEEDARSANGPAAPLKEFIS